MLVLEFHNDLLQTVKFLLEKYPLKAADAVHLSSALWLRNSVKVEVTFVTPDSILIKAAESENLRTLNPLDGTT